MSAGNETREFEHVSNGSLCLIYAALMTDAPTCGYDELERDICWHCDQVRGESS